MQSQAVERNDAAHQWPAFPSTVVLGQGNGKGKLRGQASMRAGGHRPKNLSLSVCPSVRLPVCPSGRSIQCLLSGDDDNRPVRLTRASIGAELLRLLWLCDSVVPCKERGRPPSLITPDAGNPGGLRTDHGPTLTANRTCPGCTQRRAMKLTSAPAHQLFFYPPFSRPLIRRCLP